jgi:transposase-like protein
MASSNPTPARPTGRKSWRIPASPEPGELAQDSVAGVGPEPGQPIEPIEPIEPAAGFDLGPRPGLDLAELRRQRFAHGPVCPRCDSRRVHRWGRFGERRRYRCLGCSRTFSDLTGTPLAYLKRLDRWGAFSVCMRQARSVRHTAAALQVATGTAFRWRHRLLDAVRAADAGLLEGDLVLSEFWLPFSEKGRRDLDRPGRRRGQLWPGERAWILLARDIQSAPFAAHVGPRRPTARALDRVLSHRAEPDINLHDASGPYGQVARFARLTGRGYRRLRGARLRSNPAVAYGVKLRRWLRPFNGVATRYLPNYLAWHRLLTLGPARQDGRLYLDPLRLPACAFP